MNWFLLDDCSATTVCLFYKSYACLTLGVVSHSSKTQLIYLMYSWEGKIQLSSKAIDASVKVAKELLKFDDVLGRLIACVNNLNTTALYVNKFEEI